MSEPTESTRRRALKELMAATRPFASENRARSYWSLLSTFGLISLLAVILARPPERMPALGRLALAIIQALIVVRGFILYHDHFHGALLRGSPLARGLCTLLGLFVLTPPRVWKQTHNYHHAHTAQLVGSNVGSFITITPAMYRAATPIQRLVYRITRHPLNIAFAVVTIFLYGMCVSSLLRSVRRFWDSALAIAFHVVLAIALIAGLGFDAWLYSTLIPLTLACAMGAYLFYAQHNFPDIYIAPRDKWDYVEAALRSSSYMETGPLLGWFTGNIGFHHVHHLNPGIPFYRLPEAMAAVPELQNPPRTSLHPRDVLANFRLKLWDPQENRMVGYPQ